MRFLIDQNVDDVVEEHLSRAGFQCFKVREIAAANAPDQLIAFVAETEGLVIITHDRDYRVLSRLIPAGFRHKVREGAGVVHLTVKESQALNRLLECIAYIEFAYEDCKKRRIRMHLRITNSGITLTDNVRPQ